MRVVINMAMSADGKIASASREYPKLTSARDLELMDELRGRADAVIVGASTLRALNPPLGVRDETLRAQRRRAHKPEQPLRVVVTRTALLDPRLRFFTEASPASVIVATVTQAPADRVALLSPHAEVWQLGEHSVDLPVMLARLTARGVSDALVEGGGELNWAMVRAGLVDELYVTIAPSLLGGRSAPTILGGEGFVMAERPLLTLVDVTQEGDELYCHYIIVRHHDDIE